MSAQRHLTAPTFARMASGPRDEAMQLSILGRQPAAEAEPPDLEPALSAYVRLVAQRVGVPTEAVTHEVTDTATAYLGLTARATEWPHRDLMLVWDERLGWYIGAEPRGNDQPPVICHLGGHIVPPPATVARFVVDVVRGQCRGWLGPVPARLDRARLAAHMAAVTV